MEQSNSTIELVAPESHDPDEHIQVDSQLVGDITSLWSAHVNAKNAARATSEELRNLRAKLGEQLSEMKEILAKPGCDGQWSAFLGDRNIPRATADRLVARHLRSLEPDSNRPTEAGPESTDQEVRRLFASVWPKLRRTLRSQQSVLLFIDLVTSHYEHSEPKVHEIPPVTPDTPTFGPPSSDGDSDYEPEVCFVLPPELNQEVVSAPSKGVVTDFV